MPTWLTEDPSPVYLILGLVALGLFVAYRVRRQRKFLYGVVGVAVLAGVVWLIDYLVVTDREQIVQNVGVMAAAASRRDLERVFDHVSNDFRHGSLDKAGFRQAAEQAVSRHNVRDIQVWDFEPGEIAPATRTAKIAFKVKFQSNVTSGR